MPNLSPTNDGLPAEWAPGIDALLALPDGGVALLIGGADTGKTTFAVKTGRIISDHHKLAIVNADPARSAASPPGTVSVTWGGQNTEQVTPAAVFFVGAFHARHSPLETVAAACRAVHWARAAGAQRVIVDTGSWIAGVAARRLKAAKAQAISPSLIVGFQRNEEIADLLSVLSCAAGGATIVTLPTPATFPRKTAAQRDIVRRAQLASAFTDAEEIRLPFRGEGSTTGVHLIGTALNTGTAIPGHLTRWITEVMRLPVLRAEIVQDVELALFVEGEQRTPVTFEADCGIVAQHFRVRSVQTIRLSRAIGAYVGLIDGTGRLIAPGRFEGLDADTNELRIRTHLAASERVRIVHFGRIRVARDGTPEDESKRRNP